MANSGRKAILHFLRINRHSFCCLSRSVIEPLQYPYFKPHNSTHSRYGLLSVSVLLYFEIGVNGVVIGVDFGVPRVFITFHALKFYALSYEIQKNANCTGATFPAGEDRQDPPRKAYTRPALVSSTPCARGNTRREIPAPSMAAYVRHTVTVILWIWQQAPAPASRKIPAGVYGLPCCR